MVFNQFITQLKLVCSLSNEVLKGKYEEPDQLIQLLKRHRGFCDS